MDRFEKILKAATVWLVTIVLVIMFVRLWISEGFGAALMTITFMVVIVIFFLRTLRGVGGWIEGGNQIQDGGLKVRKGKSKRK